jgi:regulator of RNase E activity RraA
MPPGVVAVWAGGDIGGVCCFGDLLAEAMKVRGVAGIVVDGGVRDVAFLRTLGTPILARYRTPAQAIGRWRVTGYQVPVRLRGSVENEVLVQPGDIVVADDDGVIVIPQRLLPRVMTGVGEMAQKESVAREDIRQGMPLLAALEKYGHL